MSLCAARNPAGCLVLYVLPLQVLRKAIDVGMIGSDIPKKIGGRGLSLVYSAPITEEIAAACPGLATSIFDSSGV